MKEYNLTQRTAHAVSDANAENPEKTLADDVLLEIDVVRYALEMINGNFPREQVAEAYDKFMDFWQKAISDYCQLKYGVGDLDREIQGMKKDIQTAESNFYSYQHKEEQIQTQIKICGYSHPFRKAELKRELAELQKEGKPELPKSLYVEIKSKTEEYEQKKELFANLEKDFDKLSQIAQKLKEILKPAKELEKNIMPKRHK